MLKQFSSQRLRAALLLLRGPWSASRAYCAAFLIFLSSRGVVLLAVDFASKFVPQSPDTVPYLQPPPWYRHLLRYDAGWYLIIMQTGYSYNGNDLEHHPVVFYPLYPLLSKLVATVFGVKDEVALLLVANLSLCLAIVLFFKLVKEEYGTEVGLYSVALFSFFPTALFLSAGYTESLTFLLIVSFFLLLKKERFLLAACCAGLATATRSTGVVLLLPLLWELWRRFRAERKRLPLLAVACTALAVSGLLLYMVYLWIAFRSPLAFASGQLAWQGGRGGFGALFQVLTLQPLIALTQLRQQGLSPNALAPWWFLIFLLLIVFYRRRLPLSYSLYALGVLLLPYLTLSAGVGFVSFPRYILLAFPVFIVAGELCARWRWLGLSLTGLLAGMLFMYTVLYAQLYWAG
jgi:Gpi18-like mannosyltransferase